MSAQDKEMHREPMEVSLIHHMAKRDHPHPPGTLPALQACIEAGARIIEIDISLLADGEFALYHGPLLDHKTTGSGPIRTYTSEQVRELRHNHKGEITSVPMGLLPEALALLSQYPGPVELQLDLKPDVYSPDEVLPRLVRNVRPVKDRIRITSPSDWALRRLHKLDSELLLGFDPLLYLEADLGKKREPGVPPFRKGAYDYWDDHPLASRKWGPPADYLAARAEALYAQVPEGMIWYIHGGLLEKIFEDGFDWIAYLHALNSQVDAWTLDAQHPEHAALVRRLIAKGIDRITTNDAPALADTIGTNARY